MVLLKQLQAVRFVTAWAEFIFAVEIQIHAGFVWQQGSSERSIKRCTAITARLHTCMQSGTAASGQKSRLLKSGASSSSMASLPPVLRMQPSNGLLEALLAAAAGADQATIQASLRDGATPAPPLIEAARDGDMESLLRMLDEGVDANMVDCKRWSPLMHAAHRGHACIVTMLLQRGADPSHTDASGVTAAAVAALAYQQALESERVVKQGNQRSRPVRTGEAGDPETCRAMFLMLVKAMEPAWRSEKVRGWGWLGGLGGSWHAADDWGGRRQAGGGGGQREGGAERRRGGGCLTL